MSPEEQGPFIRDKWASLGLYCQSMSKSIASHIAGENSNSPTNRLARHIANLTGGDTVSVSDDVRRRLFVLIFVSLVIPVVALFAIEDIAAANAIDAGVETAFAAILLLLALFLLKLKRPEPVYFTVLSLLLLFLSYLVADPVEGADRIVWLFVVVPVATFAVGRWAGSLFGVVMLLVALLVSSGAVTEGPAIEEGALLRFVASYVILGVLVHVAEYARERTHRSLGLEHRELVEANRRIQILSITDPLTGCYNRKLITDRLPAEVERARRYNHPLSIMLCDLDHFKVLNDNHGHLAGDEFLRLFAEVLRRFVRHEVDWVARYGGEEFLVVLPETPLVAAELVAERLRREVAKLEHTISGERVGCTASFGVVELTDPAAGAEGLILAADQALYRAKEGGRNRVVLERGA